MKIYHVSQDENDEYDTYSDFVVIAENEDQAIDTDPNGSCEPLDWKARARYSWSSWATKRENVKAQYIGEAHDEETYRVVCASFHAG